MRKRFARIWFDCGEHLRTEVGDDRVLVDGLRALMPPYRGRRPVVLYRGDSFWNRRRRTYGLCWSRARTIAEQHAQHQRKRYKDGSVLLQTTAPPEAIVCSLIHYTDSIEQEFLIDRRLLGPVKLLERWEAISPESGPQSPS